MWRFYSLRLGLFLLTAGAEREDFLSNLPEQTKGTVVTKYGLLVKKDAIVHGTEAVPTQTTHRGTEEEMTAKFPKTKVFDRELKPTNEGIQTATSLVTALQSMEHLRSSNVQNSLKSSTAYLSDSKVPVKSNSEKIVLASPQAALALNDALETQVHLSADVVKATAWFHAPRAVGSHRNANSVIPTSADAGLLLPILSASRPRVIDNLMELFNDSDDKVPQGKSITNLGGNVNLSGTTQSILQSEPTEDSMKGNAVTDLCLTCLKDGKAMSREKFAAQAAASPHVSSGFLSLATLSHSFHPLSAGESNEIKDRNSTKDAIIYNHTLNKTEYQTVSFVSQIAAEMSSVIHNYTMQPTQTYPGKTLATAKPHLKSTAQYPSKSLYTGEKPVTYGQQEVFYKKVSFREPQSKPMHFTENKKKASHSLSTNLKNQDISSEPVSIAPFIAPHSSFNSLLPKGLARGAASHPTARMSLIEALGAITPFTLRRPTASTVKNLKPRFLTARAGAFISVSSSQTESKATSQTKQPILTLLPKGSTIRPPSVTHRHFLDEQDSQTFTFEGGIVKPSPVNLQTKMNMTAMIKLQTSTFGARKVTPVRVFGSRSGLGSGNDMSQSALTTLISTSFKEAQSKTIQGRDFEGNMHVTNQNTYREAGKMKGFITKTSKQEHVTLRRDKDLQHAEVKDGGDAKRDGVTKINTESSTLGAARKQREFLEEKGAQSGSGDSIKFNKDIWKQDVTNVPLEPATNWKELNVDKERIVEKLSSCHGLIKELEAFEHKGVHLGENASQIGDLTNKSFSFEVTSNRQLPHPSVKSQAPNLRAELPKEDITLPLKEASPQKVKVTFPATAMPKLSEFIDILKPLISPSSSAAKKANVLSLTTRFQNAQSHLTVNSSLNVSIIHSTTDHKHKCNCSVLKAEPVLHAVNEQGHAEYVKPSTHQQMYDDSSTKTPTVTVLSSEPRVSVGPLQPHQGQSAAQRSHSSSCSNTTPGQLCPSRLSQQAFHPDTSAVENKPIFSQAQTLSGIPAAGIDRLPFESVSPVMKLRMFRSDRLTVTDMLQKLTRSQQTNFVPGSNLSKSLLGTSGETNQSKKKDDVMFMMTLNSTHSDGVTGDKHMTVRSKHVANNTDEFNSTTLQLENETKQNDLSNAGGKDEANNIIMTLNRHHRFELEDSTQFGHITNYVDTNDRAGTAAFFQTDSLPKRPKIQSDNELYPSSVIRHRVAKTTERHNSQSLSQRSESNNSVHIANSNLSINLILTHQILDQTRTITSQFQMKANKTADFVSETVTPAAIREGFKSLLTTSETRPDSKKSTQNAVERISQPNAHTKPLTQRELPITHSSDKLTPAVPSIKTIETHIVKEQPEREILAQAAKQGQHALLSTTTLSHTINMPKSEFLKMAHRAGEGYGQTSAATEQTSDLSFKGIKSFSLLANVYGEHSQGRVGEHKKQTLPETTSISQAVFGHLTDSVPHADIPPTESMNKTSCTSIGCATSSETTKAGVIDHTEEMYKTQIPEKDNFHAQNANRTKFGNYWNFHRSLPAKPAPQVIKLKVTLSSVTSKWHHDYTSDDTVSKKAKSTSDKTVQLERKDTRQWAKFVTKRTQRHFQNTSRAAATEGTLSESGAAAVETTIKSTEQTLPAERNAKTQLDRRAGRARMLEEQNASRSPHAQAKEETAGPESGSRLLVSEPQTKSELPRLNQRRRTSPHQYVSGVTEISDDLCGSGNYTAEMRLKMGRIVEPGDVVPAQGNLRVIINLKTNNSRINLGVTSCCLSPILQLDVTSSTCCLFSRPAAELSGITLLPSALSTSASFTISLFQMINYSVVYLHCDLSVCLRNHSDCERQCLQRRSAFPSEDAGTVMANLRNRISFGPVLKQAQNSTIPTEIDPSGLDLILVFISLTVGFSLVSVMLLLVWLAYHRRAIWLLRSAAPSQACCSCLRPGGDLILP